MLHIFVRIPLFKQVRYPQHISARWLRHRCGRHRRPYPESDNAAQL